MTDRQWLARMTRELWQRGVVESTIDQVVAEVAGHARDSGQPLSLAFGLPEAYAAQVASTMAGYVATAPQEPGPVRLTASGIGKRYGRRWVLRDVNLTLRAGEVAAVVGANGAGKSTFLHICAGLLGADRGTVAVDGRIGFCPQSGGMLDFLRPDEHFVLVGAGRGLSRDQARQAGREAAVALQWNASRPIQARHLSGGTRQKLNLALAVLGDPDVLLLDEPYQGFDQGTYLDFWDRVWQWRDRGKAILVVTHLLQYLDRVDTVLDLTREEADR